VLFTQKLLRRLMAPAISRGRAFSRDERGVTAVEFAILALPFFTMVFAILETAMVFFATQVLDSAVEDASRMVKTGRAQSSGYDLAAFRTLMCGYTFNLFDCSAIKLQIKPIANFTSTTTSLPPVTCSPTCELTVPEEFTPGSGRQVIQVTAYYRWPLIVTLPYFNIRNQSDNYRLLMATRVFRNEPFT
jgi:Flp pilus assembly protein TadG